MKSRFKVLSLMSVFLLLLGGVALANNATQVLVEISYPCDDGQDECDTGEAVSRAAIGDEVNVYVTLLDESDAPATAGPLGESLNTLTATVSSTLGSVDANEFAADAQTVGFAGDATARANIDYTDATPGIDQVICSVSSDPDPLVGSAEVNVVAPPAVRLVARTLRSMPPPQNIYDAIPDQQNNGDADEPAGFNVPVTIIADAGGSLYTPDPALEGKTVTVKAYADYSEDDNAGLAGAAPADSQGDEEDSVGEAPFTFQNGIATGTVQINSAGPDGLNIVFTAEVITGVDEDGDDIIISTTLMGDPGVALGDFTVDTVNMNPLSPDALLIGSDPDGNGNLVMPEDCYAVLDDNATPVSTLVSLVDSLGNAVNADGDVAFTGDFGAGSTVDEQLTFSCTPGTIGGGTYSEGCTMQDTNPAPAGTVVPGLLTVSDTALASDSVELQLVPGSGGVLDLDVTVDKAGDDIAAGDEVEITLDCSNGVDCYLPVVNGDSLEIRAINLDTDEMQLLSSSDFASADTTITISASDENEDLAGWQLVPIKIYGPCSIDPDQNVQFTVRDTTRCDIEADSDNINDIDPGEADKLAIVELATDVETDSDLDDDGFVGTDPIEIDTPFIADGATINPLLDEADSCDAQVWDEFDNVLEDEPTLACTSTAGSGIIGVDACVVDAVYVTAAVGTTDTITCEVDIVGVDARNFSIPDILAAPVDPATNEATAIVLQQEGPQEVDGDLIPPCGEGLIQISANGTLSASKNIEIFFGLDSDAGAELRTLVSDTALPMPFPVTLSSGEVKRFVVYLPTGGGVVVGAADLGSEPLLPAELELGFCGDECDPEVTITCTETELCDPEICTTCTAQTTCDDDVLEGSYTWELNGTAATTNTGNSIEVCGADLEDGANELEVTDTANEGIQDTEALTCGGVIPTDCVIDVIPDSLPKSHWIALPAIFRIETLNFDFGLLGLDKDVTIECETDGMGLVRAILPTGTFRLPSLPSNTDILLYTGLIWPAALTQSLEMESETCTATVCGPDAITGDECCASDTFELNYLSIFGIPLAQ